jgi:hypothetical protein
MSLNVIMFILTVLLVLIIPYLNITNNAQNSDYGYFYLLGFLHVSSSDLIWYHELVKYTNE